MIDQQPHVAIPLTERRQTPQDIEAEKQVFPEPALLDQLFQVVMGAGDQPHIDRIFWLPGRIPGRQER